MVHLFQSVRKDVIDFSKLSPQIKFLLVIQLIVLFVLSILVGIIFSPRFKANVQPQKFAPSTASTPEENVKKTTYTITPGDQVLRVGETQTFTVQASGDIPVANVIVLEFDPAYIHVANATNGTIYQQLLVNEINEDRLEFSNALALGQSTSTLKEPVDVFTFEVTGIQETQKTDIAFNWNESHAVLGNKNIINEAQGVQLHVFSEKALTGTPTPAGQ